MAKPPGKCIFCNRPGDLTHAHIWPDWLKKYNLPEDNVHYQVRLHVEAHALDKPKGSIRRKQGHSGSQKPRIIGRDCNSGWIRLIEEAVMNLVPRLMTGETMVLSPHDQRKLATWLTLLSTMAEYTDPPTQAIQESDRYLFYQLRDPLPGWRYYVARYTGTNWRLHIYRHFGLRFAESDDKSVEANKCDTQVSTFVLGQFCAHTYRSVIIPDDEFPGYVRDKVVPIWPTDGEDIQWPLENGLGDNGIITLSNALPRFFPSAKSGS